MGARGPAERDVAFAGGRRGAGEHRWVTLVSHQLQGAMAVPAKATAKGSMQNRRGTRSRHAVQRHRPQVPPWYSCRNAQRHCGRPQSGPGNSPAGVPGRPASDHRRDLVAGALAVGGPGGRLIGGVVLALDLDPVHFAARLLGRVVLPGLGGDFVDRGPGPSPAPGDCFTFPRFPGLLFELIAQLRRPGGYSGATGPHGGAPPPPLCTTMLYTSHVPLEILLLCVWRRGPQYAATGSAPVQGADKGPATADGVQAGRLRPRERLQQRRTG